MMSYLKKITGFATYSNGDIIRYCQKKHFFKPDYHLIKLIQDKSSLYREDTLEQLFEKVFSENLDYKKNFVNLTVQSVFKRKYKREIESRDTYYFDRNFQVQHLTYQDYLLFDFENSLASLTSEKRQTNYDKETSSGVFDSNYQTFGGVKNDTSSYEDYHTSRHDCSYSSSHYSGGGRSSYSGGSDSSYSSSSSD